MKGREDSRIGVRMDERGEEGKTTAERKQGRKGGIKAGREVEEKRREMEK